MISVSHLTKYYGDYAAVRDVSFEVARGQVVGFLGPNGAGKSTTMRILAGFITATSGEATIAGFDVLWDSLEVRRRIGYMPESCPLYTDMRVEEYLHFRAGIKGIHGPQRRQRIDYVTRRCWVHDVRRQVIGTLSKGYRQRVGLADALLANPPVLILDEPTAGLDPTQIRSTRELIRELGREHTILLSTHILPEVEAACDSVIIIHKGRVALQSSLEELKTRGLQEASLTIRIEGTEPDVVRSELGKIGSARLISIEHGGGATHVRLETMDIAATTGHFCNLATFHNWQVRDLRPERPTLEDLFVQITGRENAEGA
jgi:ABC-2 type transport system ATP-binding protein